jgi:hypothetical protein
LLPQGGEPRRHVIFEATFDAIFDATFGDIS